MDIKRAKQEIKDSIEAYWPKMNLEIIGFRRSARDRSFWSGPPGIGKTQIMEQIAKECRIAGSIHDHTSYKTECGRAVVYSGKRVRWENGICNRVHDE